MCARPSSTGKDVVVEEDGDAGAASAESSELRRGFLVGLQAGAVATVVMSVFRVPISRSPPPTARFWAKYVGGGSREQYQGVGFLLHLLYGIAAGGAFGAAMSSQVDEPVAKRERVCTACGALYGIGLSKFGTAVVLSRVLGLDLEPDERFVFDVSHVIYGLTLGTWFGSRA